MRDKNEWVGLGQKLRAGDFLRLFALELRNSEQGEGDWIHVPRFTLQQQEVLCNANFRFEGEYWGSKQA